MNEPELRVTATCQHDVVRALKSGAAVGPTARPIEILQETGDYLGSLTAIGPAESDDPVVCESLTRWRRMFQKYFLTQFEPTPERTRRWLTRAVLPDDTRILFLIRDQDGRPVGNFGVCGIGGARAELDNLIRGEKGGHARLVYYAEVALLAWCFETLRVSAMCLHVFHTNARTVKLHESVGFVERGRRSLWQVETTDAVRLVTDAVPRSLATGIDLLLMELTRDEFHSRHAWAQPVARGIVWTR